MLRFGGWGGLAVEHWMPAQVMEGLEGGAEILNK